MGPAKDQLDFEQEVEDGWAILVPAGTWHNVTNIGDEPMRLYAVYAPNHHAAGKVHATAADAEQDEESGTTSRRAGPCSPPSNLRTSTPDQLGGARGDGESGRPARAAPPVGG